MSHCQTATKHDACLLLLVLRDHYEPYWRHFSCSHQYETSSIASWCGGGLIERTQIFTSLDAAIWVAQSVVSIIFIFIASLHTNAIPRWYLSKLTRLMLSSTIIINCCNMLHVVHSKSDEQLHWRRDGHQVFKLWHMTLSRSVASHFYYWCLMLTWSDTAWSGWVFIRICCGDWRFAAVTLLATDNDDGNKSNDELYRSLVSHSVDITVVSSCWPRWWWRRRRRDVDFDAADKFHW